MGQPFGNPQQWGTRNVPLNPASNPYYDYVKYAQMLQQNMLGGMGQTLSGLAGGGLPSLEKVEHTRIDVKKIAALKKSEPRIVTAKMPDGFVPGVSWRAWKASAVSGEWRLFALGSTGEWTPKKAMQAVCNSRADHPAPHRDCNCGIWSFQTLEKLVPALAPYEVLVLGQVSIWGRIIETENGFRSQFAYPKELWLLDNSLEQLGYIYGVPVRML